MKVREEQSRPQAALVIGVAPAQRSHRKRECSPAQHSEGRSSSMCSHRWLTHTWWPGIARTPCFLGPALCHLSAQPRPSPRRPIAAIHIAPHRLHLGLPLETKRISALQQPFLFISPVSPVVLLTKTCSSCWLWCVREDPPISAVSWHSISTNPRGRQNVSKRVPVGRTAYKICFWAYFLT